MSDTPQGPDWWQASDDKWYPPPRPVMPGEETTAYPTAPPTAPVGAAGPAGPYTPPGAAPSPYGGMPAPQPGSSGGPDRTALFVALGVLVAVAGVVLVIALASGGDDDDPQAGSTTTADDSPVTTRDVESTRPPETTEDTGPTTPGDSSAIEVVEEGWSTFTDFNDTPTGSYGFIIENTGDEIILGAELSVTVYDEGDGVVKTASGTVGSLQPGQRLGFGGDLYGDDVSNGVGDIDVQVGQAQFPLDVPTDGELTVSGIDWTGDNFGLDVTFTVESTYSTQIDAPGASAIFRNAAGDIVGGASGAMSNFIPPNGSTGGQVSTIENVPGVESMEVFVAPGGYYF